MTDDHGVLGRAAADLEDSVRSALGALGAASAADWSVPAGELNWTCWETLEHLVDGLFAYALQLGPARPPLDHFVQLGWRRERPEAPTLALSVDRAAGAAALLEAVEAAGAVLGAMVRTAAPTTRAFHAYGVSDPEGFAAMGVVETVVHADDVHAGSASSGRHHRRPVPGRWPGSSRRWGWAVIRGPRCAGPPGAPNSRGARGGGCSSGGTVRR